MLKQLQSKLTKKHTIAGAIILALAFGFGGWTLMRGPAQQPDGTGQTGMEEPDPALRDPLTGLPVSTEQAAGAALPRVYAVMIDNSVDAWPASGIDKAFLVIEAPVEASIPRLEAFFAQGSVVEKIGPVRSARPYFVDWANEFDALYAHVGGSNAALELIVSTGTFDLNEFFNGSSFWRATDRSAPHNAYTSSELLSAAVAKAEERGRAPETMYGTWTWKDSQAGQAASGQGATVRFNSELYTATWEYDASSGQYLRSQGGRDATAADGTRLTASNVAIVVTDVEVLDAVGRREVRTVGEGRAWLLQDGRAMEATWKKPSVSERLSFYGADGIQLPMNAGNTWIEVVPSEGDVEIGSN